MSLVHVLFENQWCRAAYAHSECRTHVKTERQTKLISSHSFLTCSTSQCFVQFLTSFFDSNDYLLLKRNHVSGLTLQLEVLSCGENNTTRECFTRVVHLFLESDVEFFDVVHVCSSNGLSFLLNHFHFVMSFPASGGWKVRSCHEVKNRWYLSLQPGCLSVYQKWCKCVLEFEGWKQGKERSRGRGEASLSEIFSRLRKTEVARMSTESDQFLLISTFCFSKIPACSFPSFYLFLSLDCELLTMHPSLPKRLRSFSQSFVSSSTVLMFPYQSKHCVHHRHIFCDAKKNKCVSINEGTLRAMSLTLFCFREQ